MSESFFGSTRRSFLGGTLAAGVGPILAGQATPVAKDRLPAVVDLDGLDRLAQENGDSRWWPWRAGLAPERWIWMLCQRVLPCTFVLFRRELTLAAQPRRAPAWIAADSRYRLTVNGRRLQWGPAPCDPRELDVDPVDLAPLLEAGKNVIGVEVLFYGQAEGTWPGGKPGLLFLTRLEMPGGATETIASDDQWLASVDRAHRPGQPKRWFLRALQEEFDARLHPSGWDTAQFQPGARWAPASVLDCPGDKGSACARGGPWSGDTVDRADPNVSSLRLRQIPAVQESLIAPVRLAESGFIEWLRDPNDWFDFRIPGSFRIDRHPSASSTGEGQWRIDGVSDNTGAFATFEFREQIAGWPYFTIDAPAGTIVEVMQQESHDPAKTAWLDTHFFSWSRFICQEGVNRFETFDYECLRWLQLHVRQASRPVTIRDVGVRRRQFAWPHEPHARTGDSALQSLFDASVNTLRNSAIETVVDGMGRERQQYSGDGAHQLHAIRYAFGETRLGRRYLRTFSEGLTKDGYFLDCWPAGDRLARIPQKELDGAFWGPLLDHGVGFNFDCWNHYFETGEREAVLEPYPRLTRFADYLWSLRGADGLLPVENLGIPTVWMDHNAYKQPRHKQCAFNLYAAAMYRHALGPLASLMGDAARAHSCDQRSADLLAATVRRFWSARHGTFVNNLPWIAEEKEVRLCDRSLATAILFDQCPGSNTAESLRALAESPPEMGYSYPANQGWRMWALARMGRVDVILRELRTRWIGMRSVRENNTLQEDWEARTDSTAEWSHCPLAPLFVAFMDLAGIRPLTPGFGRCRIRPQLGDLPDLEMTAWTPHGPIEFRATAEGLGHRVRVALPAKCEAELVVPRASTVPAARAGLTAEGLAIYRIPSGGSTEFHLASR
jgi:hypothetical protein